MSINRLYVSGSVFANNTAREGGAIRMSASTTATIVNSTIVNNGASRPAGGVQSNGDVTIVNSTIAGNRANTAESGSPTGGGIQQLGGTLVLQNTIVAGNYRYNGKTASDISNATLSNDSTHNLIGTGGSGGLTDGVNGNLVGVDWTTVLHNDGTSLLLEDNGGPTQTVAPIPGTAAIDGVVSLVTPSTVTSSTAGTDLYPAANLINNSGLSGPVDRANLNTATHASASSTTTWVTAAPGSDYFATTAPVPALTFEFNRAYWLSDLVLWGYHFGSPNNNEAKSLLLEFSTDGGSSFHTSVELNHQRTAANAETLPFGRGILADTVRMRITDNHYGTLGALGGDRVGLGEVKFIEASPAVDQRGIARPQEFAPDIGAFEFSRVANRRVFYNDSNFDGSSNVNAEDDHAIAVDKQALLPGETARFQNYSSYIHGINGIMVDLAGASGVSSSDFEFRVGNDDNPAAWPIFTVTPSVLERPGDGVLGTTPCPFAGPGTGVGGNTCSGRRPKRGDDDESKRR